MRLSQVEADVAALASVLGRLLAANPAAASAAGPSGATPLHDAVLLGSTLTVRALLQAAPQAAAALDSKGRTPLHFAAQLADRDMHVWMVRHLLEAAPEAATAAAAGGTMPLHDAAAVGHPDIVKRLLAAAPAAAAAVDQWGCTPLHYAAEAVISRQEGRYDSTTFREELENHALVVRLLLGAAPESAALTDEDGWCPLHWAAQLQVQSELGDQLNDLIKMLIQAAPEAASAKDSEGCTPLSYAAAARAPLSAVSLLLAAAPEAAAMADGDGRLPLHHAALAARGSRQLPDSVAQLLLAAFPAAAEAADALGRVPLHYAAGAGPTLGGHESTIDWLLEMLLEAAPRLAFAQDAAGRTPLDYASNAHRPQGTMVAGPSLSQPIYRLRRPVTLILQAQRRAAMQTAALCLSRDAEGLLPADVRSTILRLILPPRQAQLRRGPG